MTRVSRREWQGVGIEPGTDERKKKLMFTLDDTVLLVACTAAALVGENDWILELAVDAWLANQALTVAVSVYECGSPSTHYSGLSGNRTRCDCRAGQGGSSLQLEDFVDTVVERNGNVSAVRCHGKAGTSCSRKRTSASRNRG